MILLLSNGEGDQPIEEVMDWLDHYKGKFIRINSNEFMDDLNYTLRIGDKKKELNIYKEKFNLNLKDINVIWYWRWHTYGLETLIPWQVEEMKIKTFMYSELETITQLILRHNPSVHVWGDKYINKLTTLIKANEVGLLIPETLVTRDKNEILDFLNEQQDIIVKPLSNPIFLQQGEKRYGMYTQRLTKEDVISLPEKIFPVLLQKEIIKKLEIRTFFIDNTFYSGAIASQKDKKTQIDFRNYNLEKPNRFIPCQLPEKIEEKLRKLFYSLNLETGSADLIYNDDYYFLEINPVGQFGMLANPCNYNLSKLIAKYLIQKDISYGN